MTMTTIVAVGSVDGVLTAAAALSLFPEAQTVFTQAFTVDKLTPSEWAPGEVLFVDLAVNNQNMVMTVDFVKAIQAAGHTIVGVCDEHDAAAWDSVFQQTGINAEELIVTPCSQREDGQHESSGALFAETFADQLDDHGFALCLQADQADHMDFSGELATVVNQAVKSRIQDNSRREHLAAVLSQSSEIDETIAGWIKEYEVLLKTNNELIETRENLGDGIVRINATGKRIDMTSLMSSVYQLDGVRVLILVGESYNKDMGKKVVQHSFGTRSRDLDLLAVIKAAGVSAGGFAQKANVLPKDKDVETAVDAVRNALNS